MSITESFFLIEVKLIYSVVLVSGVKQGDSVFLCMCGGGCVCVLFQILFHLGYCNVYLMFYLFLAVLGLRCFAQAFSGCGKQGPLFAAAHRFFIAVASLVTEHRL